MSQLLVRRQICQKVQALWAQAALAVGASDVRVEGDPSQADADPADATSGAEEVELAALDRALLLLDLDDDAAAILEAVVVTRYDVGAAVLATGFARALGRQPIVDAGLLDLAFSASGAGVGLASTALASDGVLRQRGAIQGQGSAVEVGAALEAFLFGPPHPTALGRFETPSSVSPPVAAALLQSRAGTLGVVDRLLASGRPLLLTTPAGFGAEALLAAVAERRQLALRTLPLRAIFDADAGLPTELMSTFVAEARLGAAVWCVHGLEHAAAGLDDGGKGVARLVQGLLRVERPMALLHEGPLPPALGQRLAASGGIPMLALEALGRSEREALWDAALQAAGFAAPVSLAAQEHVAHLSLGSAQISVAAAHAAQQAQARQASAMAEGSTPPAFAPTRSELRVAATTAMSTGLRQYGSRVDSSGRWGDLVLPEAIVDQIHEVARFARHRKTIFDDFGFAEQMDYGRALSAMFSGPSGTGKTMVAGLIAAELGVELYRVDLSRVVSKYIGETEERLGQLFSEATQTGAALLFDEADSLFGARTEIRSSNDRYANLEVNYLLQRLEEFDGVVILTTNFATSIDEAFLRRLRFRIQFPFPDKAERTRLWEKMLPSRLPVEDDLDFEWMGEAFELSGGHIRNAVLRAGLYVADAGGVLTQRQLYDAAAVEVRELGKLAPAYPFDDDW
jgi:hypothetical protein